MAYCTSLLVSGGSGHGVHRYSLVNGRRVDFQHFKIVRALKLVMDDPCRLQDAIAGMERLLTLTFIHELNPAFQHIKHLKVAQVLMQTSGVQIMHTARILLDPDDMGPELPMRRLFDTKVAVFHKAA